MQLDKKQEELQNKLKQFIDSVPIGTKENIISTLYSFIGKDAKDGIYIHGGVGRGKTMLVKNALSNCDLKYKITHFQQFMQDVHKSIHILRKKNPDVFILHKFVEDYAKDVKILFIDELEVKDIADAMILKELILELIEQDTKIIFTSNIKPELLYLDGIQREFFLPFIKLIEKQFINFHLDTNTDYRTQKIASLENKMFVESNSKNISNIISQFSINHTIKPKEIVVYGRKVEFQKTINDILITNFKELFEGNFSTADYIEICSFFKIIIIDNIPIIQSEETDLAIRFINFIDNAYLKQVILFCSFHTDIEKIYPQGKRASEFKRTISRLKEMNSKDYPIN